MIASESFAYGIDPDLSLRIARCESELRQYNKEGSVLRGIQNPQDVGVFQINEKYHLQDSQKMGLDIHTPEGNIQYAMEIMKRDGTRHWNYSRACWGNTAKAGSELALQ